jgi:hypothetical protein
MNWKVVRVRIATFAAVVLLPILLSACPKGGGGGY